MRVGLKRDALLVFALLLFVSAYFYQDPGWNGNSRLGLTFAIVQEGRFTIDSFHETSKLATGDKSFYNGHYYSDKAIGSSLFGALVYWPLFWLNKLLQWQLRMWAVKYILTVVAIALPSALAGSLVYVAAMFIKPQRFYAYTVAIAVTLGTMWFPFTVVFFGHALAAALLFCAFFMIFRLRWRPVAYQPWYRLLIGLVLGLALITEYTTALIVVPLVVYYFYVVWNISRLRNLRSIVLPALGGIMPLAALALYNTQVFGSPWSLGYEHLDNAYFSKSMGQGLMGVHLPRLDVLFYLTLHPAQGIFWQSPVLLLSLVGLAFMLVKSRYRAEGLIALVGFVGYLLMNSGYYMWWGGWSFGPRHVVPLLPFLALPLLFVPKRLFPLVVALTLVSAAQMLIVAASAVQVPDDVLAKLSQVGYFDYSTIYSSCIPQLLEGGWAWNIGQNGLGLQAVASLLPLFAVVIAASAYFYLPQLANTRAAVQQANRV